MSEKSHLEFNLIVGAGLSGSVIARLIAEKLDEKVVLIDSRDHIAGNSYDYYEENICVHKYGSHIFHTNNKSVWQFINRFTKFNTYMHKVTALIDGIETNIPFNLNTIYDVFPKSFAERLEDKLLKQFKYNTKISILEFKNQNDKDLQFLAQYIYEKVFLNYTIKQWGSNPEKIDTSVTARVPIYIGLDDRYFQDTYQGMALHGYTQAIANMLNHPNIDIKLNTNFKDFKAMEQNFSKFKKIFYTGSIDEYFDYKFGVLPYRSVNFQMETHDKAFYQSNSVINYPCNYDFTRIHEYKYYLSDKSDKTIIAKEYSEPFEKDKNERFYPIQNADTQALYEKYLQESKRFPDVHFLGRLGDYKYYDMDQAILKAMELFEELYQ